MPRLRSGPAFVGLLLTFTVVMIGTTVPTPMYGLYASELGFSEVVSTVVFAVYAAGVLVALLGFGRWSDTLGRRPLLLAGIAFSLLSALVFLTAGPVPQLLVGRFLSGASAGIFAGTATSAVVEAAPEAWRARASFLATAANTGGLGLGPLLAGIAVQYLPAPLHLSFAVHAGLLVVVAVVVLAVPETVDVRPGARPRAQRLAVPPEVRATFVSAATAGFAGFAVLGLFTAVSPKILSDVIGVHNHAVAGLVVFAILGSSTLAQIGLRRLPRGVALDGGCVALVVGMGFILLALLTGSLTALVVGAVVSGVGQGVSFASGLAAVGSLVPPERRAEVTSTFFVVLYVAISLPVVGEGLAAQAWGLRTAGVVFTAAVAALALVALVALLRLQREPARA
ncbi:MAG: MFS transporter [Mycobacteriaceae bacterium]